MIIYDYTCRLEVATRTYHQPGRKIIPLVWLHTLRKIRQKIWTSLLLNLGTPGPFLPWLVSYWGRLFCCQQCLGYSWGHPTIMNHEWDSKHDGYINPRCRAGFGHISMWITSSTYTLRQRCRRRFHFRWVLGDSRKSTIIKMWLSKAKRFGVVGSFQETRTYQKLPAETTTTSCDFLLIHQETRNLHYTPRSHHRIRQRLSHPLLFQRSSWDGESGRSLW